MLIIYIQGKKYIYMKTRKVNRVGRDTLTISLPRGWVEENHISKGMELDIEEMFDRLIVHSGRKEQKEYVITVKGLSTFLFDKWINELYIKNASRIVINLQNDFLRDHEGKREVDALTYINELINNYIGLEIISQSEKKIVIQSLIKEETSENFHDVKQRTHGLIIELLYQILKGFSNRDRHKLDQFFRNQVKNIRKFIYYCMRIVINSDRDVVDKIKLYLLYYHIDNSLFNVGKAIKMIEELNNPSETFKRSLSKILEAFNDYLKIGDGNISTERMNELVDGWYVLIKTIDDPKLSSLEQKILRELRVFINIHNDFIRAYFHIQKELVNFKYSHIEGTI